MERIHINNDSLEITMKAEVKAKANISGIIRVVTVGILVLLQISFIVAISFILRSFSAFFYGFLQVLSIAIIISLVNDHKSPSYKISWICIVLALPVTGHIMYGLWGKEGSKKKIEDRVLAKMKHGTSFLVQDDFIMNEFINKFKSKARLSKYMINEGFPLFKNNDVIYYSMGKEVFEDIFSSMAAAEKFILINFFIVAEGDLSDRMFEILSQKVEEGVEVKFLYDDFGAMIRTSKSFWSKLKEAGIKTQAFNPIHKYTRKLYMNYRNHQKIIVIDGNIGFTGGINLADEYANLVTRFGVWKDSALKLTGDAVWGLTVTFLQMWEVASSKGYINYDKYRPTLDFPPNDAYCHVISDGPANNPRNPIENIYKQMIQYADKFLYITTPYLVLEDDMKQALITAVKSGIDVRIITPFIPDKKQVKILTNYNYGELLKNGVRIYEYLEGFIHSKSIINEDCAIVGTINMDYRSFYLHYECGIWVSNSKVNEVIKEDFLNTFKVSKEITYAQWKQRPLWLKLYQPVLNLFSTLM